MAKGGEGDDTIDFRAVATLPTDKGHTIVAAQVQTASVFSAATSALNTATTKKDYDAAKNSTILQYASGEFFTGNSLTDNIAISNGTAAVAEVSDALKITTSTDFRAVVGGAARDADTEGLIIKTVASVKAASTVTLAADAGGTFKALTCELVQPELHHFVADTVSNGFLLAGSSSAPNTITGGKGNDALIGGSGDDKMTGGTGGDRITTGAGRDSVVAGAGDDIVVMGSSFDSFDTIKGGTGADTLAFTDNGSGTTDIDGLTDFEAIELGSANTVIVLKDATVATGTNFEVAFATATTTSTLNFNGGAETNGTLSVTGAAGADTLVGGTGTDTLTGGAGADSMNGGDGADVFAYATDTTGASLVADGDTIVNFVTGTDGFSIGALDNTTGFVQGTAGAAGETLITAGTAGGNVNFVSNATGAAASAQATIAFNTATATTYDGRHWCSSHSSNYVTVTAATVAAGTSCL